MPLPKTIEEKRPVGRPVEYTEKRIAELAQRLEDFMAEPDNYWYKDFALQEGIDPARLSELANKSPVFSQALKRAKAIQEGKLLKGGLKNRFNSAVTIFALKNNHGWTDKTEQTTNINLNISAVLDALDTKQVQGNVIDAALIED